jgi:hypothetical protein
MPARNYRLVCYFAPKGRFDGDESGLETCLLTP